MTLYDLMAPVTEYIEKLAKGEITEEDVQQKSAAIKDPEIEKKAFNLGAELFAIENGITDADTTTALIEAANHFYPAEA